MKKNMSSADSTIRSILAIIIALLYFLHIITGTLAIALLIFAVALVLTSLLGFCPFYLPFGIHTCKSKSN